MKIEVKSEVNPVLGTAMGSEELVKGMLDKYDSDPESLWSTDLFGKTFRDMVREGLNAKVVAMPEDAKRKMRRTVTRIVNEGRGGVICILSVSYTHLGHLRAPARHYRRARLLLYHGSGSDQRMDLGYPRRGAFHHRRRDRRSGRRRDFLYPP